MKNHFISRVAPAAVALLFIGSPRLPAETYYVAPDGDNTHTGLFGSPWASPAYGSRQLHAGDTMIILGGTYVLRVFDDDILRPPSGADGAWVVIKGETGNRPTLAGDDNLFVAIDLSGLSYVRIENLEITHNGAAAFRDAISAVAAPMNHAVLKDLYVHHVDEFGINLADADDLLIENCRIEYCGFGSVGGPEGLHGGWQNATIRGCHLSYSGHYYGGGGPNPYDRPDGFGIEPSSGPIDLLDTTAEHNKGDGLDSKARNTHIRNCVVANNSCDGVKLWGGGSTVENTLIHGRGDGDSTVTPWSAIVIGTEDSGATFAFVNVTVDDALGENYLMHVQYDLPAVGVDLTLQNTIFCSRGPGAPIFLAGAVQLTLQNNLFYMPNTDHVLEHGAAQYDASQIVQLGQGNRHGDPLFLAPAWGTPGDYHLGEGSPAIDHGRASGAPATDLDGRSRPQGAGIDIGAYETPSTPTGVDNWSQY